ncbi:beta strand repeat-containing protein [Ferruginibacter sp.]
MRKLYLLLCVMLCTIFSHAQVTGTKTIGVDYATMAAAVTALNTTGVGAGGATINVPAGYTETVPSGGLVLGTTLLNASLSATNPLVFQKSGAGANPVLTAFTGGTSTTSDGVFKLLGTDYVTISAIDIKENAANTAAAFMEWGYAMVNLNGAAPFDGCQNVTIQNCTITLDRTNPNGSFGIYSGHNIATSSTALTITATGDLHSNNKFYGNTISNINEGIWVAGFAAASPYTLYDQNNDVGGTSAATGNTVTNGGGNASYNFFGVYMAYQNGGNASYNTINNASGGVGNNTNTYGIYFFGTTASANATFNNVTLTQASGAFSIYGIYPGNTGTTVVNNNTIQELTTAANTSTYYHIYLPNAAVSETVNNNVFNNSNINTTASVYLVYASNATPAVTVTNNAISGAFTKTGAGGTVYGYYNNGSPTSGTSTITNNNFSNVNLTGATGFYGTFSNTATAQVVIINNNTVSNVTTGAATIFGFYHSYGAVGSQFNNNTVTGLTGASTINGFQVGSTASLGITVSGNTVSNLSTTGASTVTGLLYSGGTNGNVFKNKISGLTSSNAAGVVNGVTIAAATTSLNFYNNTIGDLKAPLTSSTTDAVRGINITATTATSNLNLSYNTVNIAATSSGANFSSSALFATTSATATSASLTIKNNIFINTSTPNGTGYTSAYRRIEYNADQL